MRKVFIKMLGFYLNVLAVIAPGRAAAKGFRLWCRPFRTSITPKQHDFFNKSEKFVIEFEDISIQGYKWGDGEKKILFLHGWQSHSYRWKVYVESLLKSDYTIYSLDAPGHGLSGGDFLTVPVYGALIKQVIHELGEVHTVVGHSLGGFSLLYTFYQFPLLPVRKVVLMAPPGEAIDFMTVFKETLGLWDRTMKLIVDHFNDVYHVGPEHFSTEKFAASVNIKGIIIHDEEDKEAPYHYATRIQRAWPKSRLISTKGLGHNLKSPMVVKTMVDFIEEPLHETSVAG